MLSSIQNHNSAEQLAYQEKMYFWLWAVGFDTLKAGGRSELILSNATRNSTPKLVEDLLDRKEFLAVLNNRNEWGDTALISGIFNSSSEDAVVAIIELLLKNGADPNLRNDKGGSPLSAAKYLGRKKVIKLLMQYGAKE